MKMKIDAMIFDMDGVVYDSEKMYFAADQKAAQKLGFEFIAAANSLGSLIFLSIKPFLSQRSLE